MGTVTAYQRRKREIAYLEQRGEELEVIIEGLCAQIRSLGGDPAFPLGGFGLEGDQLITDVNTGQFAHQFLMGDR